MENLFQTPDQSVIDQPLGGGFCVSFSKRGGIAYVYQGGSLFREVHLCDKPEKRMLLVDLIGLGAQKSKVAAAFNISRQTLDNNIAAKEKWGLEGLLNGTKKVAGNKSEILAEERKAAKSKVEIENKTLPLSYFFDQDHSEEIEKLEQVYSDNHDWERCRYAGCFTYIIALTSQWKWLQLIQGIYGKGYEAIMILMFMSATNTRSIEGLKNIKSKEAGLLLGIKKLPSKPTMWAQFYLVCAAKRSKELLSKYFLYQVKCGLVSLWLWAVDGHLLPYTGKRKVHYSYNTQRKIPVPGRTTQVTTDAQGRIVDYTIEEGKGNMKDNIFDVAKKFKDAEGVSPIFIFDREAYDASYFHKLITEEISFVTWQKNCNKAQLDELADDLFATSFNYNNKNYAVFSNECTMSYKDANGEKVSFSVTKIFLWNKTSKRRVCAIAWTDKDASAKELAECILTRWGASENTFKHMQTKHPMNYNPGFVFTESDNQAIANPEKKILSNDIIATKKQITKVQVQLSEATKALNMDGTPRKNGKRDRLLDQLTELKGRLVYLQKQKAALPERVNVKDLEDYRSFDKIDNEGKYLFDFALTSVWNARKCIVEWMKDFFGNENEVVDLFYAITTCHGWIKSEDNGVTVSLEPLEAPSRRAAQEALCRKLNSLNATTPGGKMLSIIVGVRGK